MEKVMTDRSWNFDEIRTEFNGCETLGEVVRKIEFLAAATGEVVCEIRVNNKMLADDLDEIECQAQIAELQSISMRSERPESLIVQALESATGFIPVLTDASLQTAGLFKDGDVGPGNERFREVVEGCQWFVETLNHARGAASGLGQPVEAAERWHSAEGMLFKVVQELTETFDRRDVIAVADILEFELTAALEMWQPILLHESKRRSI